MSPSVVIAITCILIAVVATAVYKENRKWGAFAREHSCSVVGYVAPTGSFGVGSNGTTTFISNPAQTVYQCDDGKTYTR